MTVKKWIAMILCLLMLAVFFAGCSNQNMDIVLSGIPLRKEKDSAPAPIAGQVMQVAERGGQIAVLRADGTVRVAGDNSYFQCEVSGWQDVVKVWVDEYVTFGLTKDGTLLSTYGNYEHWGEIADLFVYRNYDMDNRYLLDIAVVAVKTDGTVVAEGFSDDKRDLNSPGYDFSGWKDIKDVLIQDNFVLGLSEDGTVYLTGDAAHDERGPIDLDWKNIKGLYRDAYGVYAVSGSGDVYVLDRYNFSYTKFGWQNVERLVFGYDGNVYGITTNGTVLSTYYPGMEIPGFHDVEEIAVYLYNVMGLRKDGSVAVYPEEGFVNDPLWKASDWTNIAKMKSYDGIVAAVKNDGTLLYKWIPGNTVENNWQNIADVWIMHMPQGELLALTKDGRLISTVVPENILNWLTADVQS